MEINFNLFELYKFDDGRLSRVRFGLGTSARSRFSYRNADVRELAVSD